LPGLDSIDHAEVILLFTRRVTVPDNQLAQIKRYLDSGKPLVAVRTASHGLQGWPEFDKTVLGGNYQGHFGLEFKQTASPVEILKDHPVLAGIPKIVSGSSLYKTGPLASDTELLMVGLYPKAASLLPGRESIRRWIFTAPGLRKILKTLLPSILTVHCLGAGRKVPKENLLEMP
jgi:hypothetical protein